MSERQKRTLIVTSYKAITTFKNQRGDDTTIYGILATNAQGVPLDAKQFPLRAFWEPGTDEIGKPVEYEVEAYQHEKYGLTYTLHRPKGSGGSGLKGSVDKLRAEIKELTGRVEALEARQGGAPSPSTPPRGSAPPLPPEDEPTPVGGKGTSDDDIPF
jgi:hypothetical protein